MKQATRLFSMTLLLLLLASQTSAAQGITIYSKANAPKEPALEDVALKPSVSQYGITWTFDKPVRVGQFINGDWYVIGTTTIIDIAPKPLRGAEVPDSEKGKRWPEKDLDPNKFIRNGSMLNPPAKSDGGKEWKNKVPGVAYDSGIPEWFRPEGLSLPPTHMKPGDSLVSTITLKQ